MDIKQIEKRLDMLENKLNKLWELQSKINQSRLLRIKELQSETEQKFWDIRKAFINVEKHFAYIKDVIIRNKG